MKVLMQRVTNATCTVDDVVTGAIQQGLLLFVSFRQSDDEVIINHLAKKVANLRIFEDGEGKMNRNVQATSNAVLSIPQFTLEASTEKGHRPSFSKACDPQKANTLFNRFNQRLEEEGLKVYKGVFSAHMNITLTNDGPVTIILERTHDHD